MLLVSDTIRNLGLLSVDIPQLFYEWSCFYCKFNFFFLFDLHQSEFQVSDYLLGSSVSGHRHHVPSVSVLPLRCHDTVPISVGNSIRYILPRVSSPSPAVFVVHCGSSHSCLLLKQLTLANLSLMTWIQLCTNLIYYVIIFLLWLPVNFLVFVTIF